MRYLRTNTATRITVGPFLDKTDGITPEVALTVTSEKLTFIVDDGGVPTLVLDVAPTASGGANDMVHITNDDSGFYDLELAAANVNYLGRAMISLNDVATHCPVFHEFMILPAVIYDAMILGTDLFDVSMTQILGTAVSTPATAGVLDINVKNMNNVAATPITTIKAVQGLTTADVIASVTGAVGSVTGAVGSVTGAVGSVTGNVGGNVVGSVASVTARVTANVDQLGGVAQSLTDLKDFADDGYDPSTNKVQGVVLTDTLTTYTGNTPQTGDSFARLGAPVIGTISADLQDGFTTVVSNVQSVGTSVTAIQTTLNSLKIRKNTALANFSFLMVQSSDHITPATGLTVACQRSIDGGAFANCNTATATEVSNGIYKVNLAAADLNGDVITLKFTSAGADQRIIVIATEL